MVELMDKPTTKEVARFVDKVQITKHCWLWEANKNKKGYGQFKFRRKNIMAHRFSYQLFVGQIGSGKQILHRRECGNRACVNPHHLYMGTPADNVRDREAWGIAVKGEVAGNSKLCKSDVLAIRKAYKTGSYYFREIADIFNISEAQARRIVRGTQWKHLPI